MRRRVGRGFGAQTHDELVGREIRVADDLVVNVDNPGIRSAENRQVRLQEFPE